MRLSFLMALFAAAAIAAPKNYLVYFGTYTGEKSKGVYVSEFDSRTGKLSPLSTGKLLRKPFGCVGPVPEGRLFH